jgi:hypothetical protein
MAVTGPVWITKDHVPDITTHASTFMSYIAFAHYFALWVPEIPLADYFVDSGII